MAADPRNAMPAAVETTIVLVICDFPPFAQRANPIPFIACRPQCAAAAQLPALHNGKRSSPACFSKPAATGGLIRRFRGIKRDLGAGIVGWISGKNLGRMGSTVLFSHAENMSSKTAHTTE